MNGPQSHWAAPLIGRPWRAGAEGPDAFDCRGLVRYVWLTQRGIDVPPLAREICEDAHAIIVAALNHGWSPIGRGPAVRPREWDIVMMTSLRGPHVGVMVQADMRLGLLHCVGGVGDDGVERGEVIFNQRLEDAAVLGFGRFEIWRRQ